MWLSLPRWLVHFLIANCFLRIGLFFLKIATILFNLSLAFPQNLSFPQTITYFLLRIGLFPSKLHLFVLIWQFRDKKKTFLFKIATICFYLWDFISELDFSPQKLNYLVFICDILSQNLTFLFKIFNYFASICDFFSLRNGLFSSKLQHFLNLWLFFSE